MEWFSTRNNPPPKTERFLALFREQPVIVGWCDMPDKVEEEATGFWPFEKKTVRVCREHRDGYYCIHGNYGPIEIDLWTPITKP